MKGNRPDDVCALCDRAIDPNGVGFFSLHRYVGRGWVHGGGREYIAVHYGCITVFSYREGSPMRISIEAALGRLFRRE
jgi:hypothetical protein